MGRLGSLHGFALRAFKNALERRRLLADGLFTRIALRAFKSELGVQAPVGRWDPAGLSADWSFVNFKCRRPTELKRGRF